MLLHPHCRPRPPGRNLLGYSTSWSSRNSGCRASVLSAPMVAPWNRHWWHYVDMDGRPTRREVLRGLAAAGLLAWVPGCSSDGGQADRRSGGPSIVGRTPGLAEVVAGTGLRAVLPIGLVDRDVVVVTYGLPDRRANINFAKTISKGYTALFEPV